jgi:hypothetical protein
MISTSIQTSLYPSGYFSRTLHLSGMAVVVAGHEPNRKEVA